MARALDCATIQFKHLADSEIYLRTANDSEAELMDGGGTLMERVVGVYTEE